jgi:glycosyltransferase involved in cell wall biosynthesis
MGAKVIGVLDSPVPGEQVLGEFQASGWVLVRGGHLAKVEAFVDGVSQGLMDILQERPDVQAARPAAGRFGGFSGKITTTSSPGRPTLELEIRVTLMDGSSHSLTRVELTKPQPKAASSPKVLVWARGLEAGGSQLRMVDVVEELLRQGSEVVVASPVEGPLREGLERAGASVEVVPAIPFGSIFEYDHAILNAAEWARGQGFGLVYSPTITGFPAVEIADLIGARSWLRIGEFEPLATVCEWLKLPLSDEVELRGRAAVALADVVQTRDQATAVDYQNRGWQGNFEVHREGTQLPTSVGDARPIREQLGLSSDDRLVLCAGTLWPVKGQGALLAALISLGDRHPNLKIACVGFDVHGYGDVLRADIEKHGLQERFWIMPFTSDLDPWFAAADVLASPSISESMSASILEAMAHGMPVIGSAVGGTPELVITGKTGWLYPLNDLGVLRDALVEVAEASPGKLARLGKRARQLVEGEHNRREVLPQLARTMLSLATSSPAQD